MTGPYRTALRLPYAEWERAVLDGSIGEKRAHHIEIAAICNRVWEERVQPALDAAMVDFWTKGIMITRTGPDGFPERVDPDEVTITTAPPSPFYGLSLLDALNPRPFELD